MFGWSQQKTWEKQKSNKKYDLYRSLFLGGRFVSISFHWFDRCGFSTHSFSRGPGEPLHRGRWRRNIDWYLWLGTALWSAWGLKRRTLLKRFTEKWMQVSFLRMFVYVYRCICSICCYYQYRYYIAIIMIIIMIISNIISNISTVIMFEFYILPIYFGINTRQVFYYPYKIPDRSKKPEISPRYPKLTIINQQLSRWWFQTYMFIFLGKLYPKWWFEKGIPLKSPKDSGLGIVVIYPDLRPYVVINPISPISSGVARHQLATETPLRSGGPERFMIEVRITWRFWDTKQGGNILLK